MRDHLELAIARSRAVETAAHTIALNTKAAGTLQSLMPSSGASQLDSWRGQSANNSRYGLFRGWLYAAINVLASEAAGQPVEVGRLTGVEDDKRDVPKKKVPAVFRSKMIKEGYEVLQDHPLLTALEQPNPIQGRWQFVYSFIANLCLTGWSYIIGGEGEDGELQYFSVPTTWVKPDHRNGPFSAYRIVNPKDPLASGDGEPIPKENVAFAHLPNPADPLGAYAPAASQTAAINIDDHIQTSQLAFFQNGIFPGVIVTVGKEPHPDVPGGARPRLSAAQRRQVVGAIRKVMGGVANYGNPAIVDGLIESIERLSATQNEMGWEKSEDKVRTRILSAFSVHPYILGEAVSVGGYAQVASIEARFFKRVNTYLAMLSQIMTNFAAPMSKDRTAKKRSGKLIVYWHECESHDPSLFWQNMREARKNGDVTRNEIRAELGLPPDETGGDRNRQFTSADVGAIVQVCGAVSGGQMQPEQASHIFQIVYDLDEETATKLAGKKTEQQEATDATNQATQQLSEAVKLLKSDPDHIAGYITSQISGRLKFDPAQPRDDHGRFTDGGSGDPSDKLTALEKSVHFDGDYITAQIMGRLKFDPTYSN